MESMGGQARARRLRGRAAAAVLLLIFALAVVGRNAAATCESWEPGTAARPRTVKARPMALARDDHLWATLAVEKGDRVQAMVGEGPAGLFLDAHRGETLTVTLERDRMLIPRTGKVEEILRLVDARRGALTLAAWWANLTPAERGAAQARFEARMPNGDLDIGSTS